jgi:hypothetical protein
MYDRDAVITLIHGSFGANEFPGDPFLQGSFEGCEPFDEVGPFRGRSDWRALDAPFLDGHGAALSFFSEAAFRFFLPAYLVADLREELLSADPLFHLTHGFSETAVRVPVAGRVFVRRSGRSVYINPRRYGAMTAYDHACYRLSVFPREEAAVIVAYLEHKRADDTYGDDTERIDGALDLFWRERARSAPTQEDLARHLAAERELFEAINSRG